MSTLVTYFSAEGTTAKVAKEFAEMIEADIFEIVPVEPYTKADIKWTNPLARCNKEQFGKKDVPVQGKVDDFEQYDTVYIGFPIWYGAAPRVINTFCQGYNWTGKKVMAFATSGGSKIGKTAEKLQPYVEGAESVDAKLVFSAADVKEW
ncbi:hypothetical protein CIY_32810 [Butyrivibrio fibrisolvens 16/4]|nr:hypothetical protein CIY_32810 [Butyrivibrio fibrisolvens 16/4]